MSYNPRPKSGLGSSLFARHYLGNRFFFLLLQLLRCFSSLGFFRYNYIFIIGYLRITTSGFPHSDISGSKITYISPKHFVVCHVLLHLLMPRHPPYALLHLITYYNPNLMRSILSIKSSWYLSVKKDITSHYPVFKELVEREHSFKTKQNILFVAPFLSSYISFSIERRWSIPTFS